MALKEKRILNVGLAALDIVMVCASYPEEDSDQRCISHEWKRGGNASNSSTVMAEFQVPCEYFGTMSTDYGGKFVKKNLEHFGICIENCVFCEGCDCPTSVVLVNSTNGSRTIVHSNKNLPEVSFENFKKLDLQKYKWIHFETRPSITEIKQMVNYVEDWNTSHKDARISVSIEIEQPKSSYLELLAHGDVVFISKDVAKMCGHLSMISAVEELSMKVKSGSYLVCLWGEKGACAKKKDGQLIVAPAYPPKKVVDTLAAGDTFIATTVMCIAHGISMEEAVHCGCRVAGAKCGIEGISGLSRFFPQLFKV